MKKPSRKTLGNKLDKLWKDIIKSRAEEFCELCARPGKDAHHIEGRSPQSLRWCLENGVFLCFRCHRLGVHSPSSSTQAEFRRKLIKLLGRKQMDELKRMRYKMVKLSLGDMEELYEQLKSH